MYKDRILINMVVVCQFCLKIYSSTQSKYKHVQRFHSADRMAEKIKKMKDKHAAELKILNIVPDHRQESTVVNNNTTIINDNRTINNTINNITINIKFGDEDIAKLSQAEVYTILNSGYTCVPTLIRLLHKNPRLPEYNNIKMTVPKNSLCRIHNGEQFVQQTKSAFFEQLLEIRADDLSDLHEKYGDATRVTHRRIKEVVKKIISCLENERSEAGDKSLSKHYKRTCDDITALLCN